MADQCSSIYKNLLRYLHLWTLFFSPATVAAARWSNLLKDTDTPTWLQDQRWRLSRLKYTYISEARLRFALNTIY